MATATVDWSQCPAVESVPDRRGGAWVFRDTRMPVATVFENLELGTSVEEIIEQYDVTREQIRAVLEFAARSLDARPPVRQTPAVETLDAQCGGILTRSRGERRDTRQLCRGRHSFRPKPPRFHGAQRAAAILWGEILRDLIEQRAMPTHARPRQENILDPNE